MVSPTSAVPLPLASLKTALFCQGAALQPDRQHPLLPLPEAEMGAPSTVPFATTEFTMSAMAGRAAAQSTAEDRRAASVSLLPFRFSVFELLQPWLTSLFRSLLQCVHVGLGDGIGGGEFRFVAWCQNVDGVAGVGGSRIGDPCCEGWRQGIHDAFVGVGQCHVGNRHGAVVPHAVSVGDDSAGRHVGVLRCDLRDFEAWHDD